MIIKLNKNILIEKTAIKLQELIKGSIFENHVFICGGFVRDKIMGLSPKDIDLCVDIEGGGLALAEYLCKKTNSYAEGSNPVIFPKFQTAKFNLRSFSDIANVDIECVQTRTEKYSIDNGRKPEVKFGTLMEDCLRRDLTINSMYIKLSTLEVIDPCGKGMEDIKNCVLRTPTKSDTTFSDDPLRMLRVIRFATRLNWGIEKDTWFGIVKNANKLENISQERITDEFNKILMCKTPSYGIMQLKRSGLLFYVIPEVRDLVGVTQGYQHFGDVFEHTMSVVDHTNEILTHRYAALLHDIAKPMSRNDHGGRITFYGHEEYGSMIAESILKTMKMPNKDIKLITTAVKEHIRFKSSGNHCPSNKAIRKFITNFNDEEIRIILDVIHADNVSHSKDYVMPDQVNLIINKINELIDKNEDNKNVVLPINGNDIMSCLKIKKGPIIGTILNKIKDMYYENPKITKQECIDFVIKNYKKNG